MTAPVRMRLSRKKGFNLQTMSQALNGLPAVSVARPSRWGNPCRIGRFRDYGAADAVRDYTLWVNRDMSVRSFDGVFGKPPNIYEIRTALRGKNIACWCPPDQPCHADVLLELANQNIEAVHD